MENDPGGGVLEPAGNIRQEQGARQDCQHIPFPKTVKGCPKQTMNEPGPSLVHQFLAGEDVAPLQELLTVDINTQNRRYHKEYPPGAVQRPSEVAGGNGGLGQSRVEDGRKICWEGKFG